MSHGQGDKVEIDVRERGANGQASDRRLFMQLLAFGECPDPKPLVRTLEAARVEAALYRDANDPRGVAVLGMSEDPTFFVNGFRDLMNSPAFEELPVKHELTMIGRTYSSGFESDLDDWLLRRPRRTALNPATPWAVWYPLRRTGAFARLLATKRLFGGPHRACTHQVFDLRGLGTSQQAGFFRRVGAHGSSREAALII